MVETLEKHFWLPAASQLYRDKVSAIRWRLQKGSAMTATVNNANTLHLMQQAAAGLVGDGSECLGVEQAHTVSLGLAGSPTSALHHGRPPVIRGPSFLPASDARHLIARNGQRVPGRKASLFDRRSARGSILSLERLPAGSAPG